MRKVQRRQSHPRSKDTPSKEASSSAKLKKLEGNAMDEFRLAVKKVEFPTVDGEVPTGGISPHMLRCIFASKIQALRCELALAQLWIEGPTIHFFNPLVDEEGLSSWTVTVLWENEKFMNNLLGFNREGE